MHPFLEAKGQVYFPFDSTTLHEFQACTPRVVPLGFGILLSKRDPRGLYKGYIKAILGTPFRGTTLGVQPWCP